MRKLLEVLVVACFVVCAIVAIKGVIATEAKKARVDASRAYCAKHHDKNLRLCYEAYGGSR